MIKPLALFSILLAAISVSSFAQKAPTKQQIKDRNKNIFSVAAEPKHFNEVIDFEMINGAIIIPVKIHGSTYHFLFDSGALTVLSDEVQESMHLTAVTKNDVSGSMGGSESMSFYNLDSLGLDNVYFTNIGVGSFDTKPFAHALCSKVDGILGANIMRTCYWKIDYVQHKISFSDQAYPKPADAYVFDFEESFSGSPLVNIKFGKFNIQAIWDSGNNRYIDVPDSAYFNSGVNLLNQTEGRGSTNASLNGPKEFNLFMTQHNIKIGENEFDNEPIRISPGKMPLIGNLFMKRHETVLLDWKKGKIYIGKKSAGIDSSVTATFGITPDYVDGVCKVAFLWKGSQADKDGIQLEDKVISINGTKTSGLSDADWCSVRNNIQGLPQLEITIEHNGVTKDYVFPKYHFFSVK